MSIIAYILIILHLLPVLAREGHGQELLQTLPGASVLCSGQSNQGVTALTDKDLRALTAVSEAGGGLRLQHQQAFDFTGFSQGMAGGSLAAWQRGENLHVARLPVEDWAVFPSLDFCHSDSLLIRATMTEVLSLPVYGASMVWTPLPPEIDHAESGLRIGLAEQVLWAFEYESSESSYTIKLFELQNAQPSATGSISGQGLIRQLSVSEDFALCLMESGQLILIELVETTMGYSTWEPPFNAQGAVHLDEDIWVLAAGESGLFLVDFGSLDAPQLLGQWNTVEYAAGLSLNGDTLLVSESIHGLSAHLARNANGNVWLEPLARNNTRPQVLSFASPQHEQGTDGNVWYLDRDFGYRNLQVPDSGPFGFSENMSLSLPAPVEGGDVRAGLLAGSRHDSGLRFYEILEDQVLLRGIHPTDPVELLAWGPDNLVAYITPTGYVAIKQANRSPWFLLHHGTVNLQMDPACVVWVGDQLWVGATDGRLFHVDASDPLSPVIVQSIPFDQPIMDLDSGYGHLLLIAAGSLHQISNADTSDSTWVDYTYPANGGQVRCCAIEATGSAAGLAVAGLGSPPGFAELAIHSIAEGQGRWLGSPHPLDSTPMAVEHLGYGMSLAACENGDLLQFEVSTEVHVSEARVQNSSFHLQTHPNPFNPATNVRWAMEVAGNVRITLHNLLGQMVRDSGRIECSAGQHGWSLETPDLPGGIYIIRLSGQGSAESLKVLLLK